MRKIRANTGTLIGTAIVLTLIAGLLLSLSNIARHQRVYDIVSFEECAEAGYPILESYPEQCATPDGRLFVNEHQSSPMAPTNNGLNILSNGCAVAGCSGQLCISASEAGNIVTTCEYQSEYACYAEASCEPQANGKCGWTETASLTQCLMNPLQENDLEVN